MQNMKHNRCMKNNIFDEKSKFDILPGEIKNLKIKNLSQAIFQRKQLCLENTVPAV